MNFFRSITCLVVLTGSFLNANSSDSFNPLAEQLQRYHLQTPKTPFTYQYATEILSVGNNFAEHFELNSEIENFAKKLNERLNTSMFFDPSFILNSKRVRQYLTKPKYFKPHSGKNVQITTEDGKTLGCTYLDRGSKKLMIVGAGFTNKREVMAPFIDMFLDYDIVLFDFRGHGYKEFKFLDPLTWFESSTKMLFSADLNEVRMGAEEEKDVFAVVDEFRKNKNYEQVVGLGVCYSALIFIKAATIRQKESEEKEKLFDKLILDGCWLSLQDYVDKLAQDPKRIFSPQYGGWKDKWPIKELWFQKVLCYLGQKLFYTKFNDVSILDYLPELKDIPILYFYGKDDMVVNRQEFEIIWNATQVEEKTVIVTSNPHVRNHLKQKEFYKLACDLFLNFTQKGFVQYLKDKDKLMQYHMNQQQNLWKTEAAG